MKRWSIAALLLLAACTKVDQPKFEQLYRTGLAIQNSSYGPEPHEVRALVRALDTEISIAMTRAKTAHERNLVALYRDAWSVSGDYSTAFKIEMMRRSHDMRGNNPSFYMTLKHVADDRIDMASRCFETAGESCRAAEGLTGKAAARIAAE